jgi:RNA polymerase sigma-70 factor (ECF subfamily)
MASRDESKTSSTLIGRLAVFPPDEDAWNQFVNRYGPRVLKWCRAHGLQDADAVDVSQSVLTVLSVRLRRFEYDRARSFRAYLHVVVRRAVQETLSSRAPRAAGGDSEAFGVLASVAAREDLFRRLEEEFDIELLETAARTVRQRVAPKSWEAYDLTAREGRPSLEVAALLGMRVGAVYQAKSSIMRMLQEEVRRLEGVTPAAS